MAAYEAGGSRIVVPQRVDPERVSTESPPRPAKTQSVPTTPGAEEFLKSIETAPEDQREELHRLADWAISLERDGLVRLLTGHGKGRWTLLPRRLGRTSVW